MDTDEGPTSVGRLVMAGESERSVRDILRDRGDQDDRSERDEAAEWIRDYLTEHKGEAYAGDVLKAGVAGGHAKRTLQRAQKRARVETRKAAFGAGWVWALLAEAGDLVDDDAEGATKAPETPASQTQAPTASSWRLREEEPAPDWLDEEAERLAAGA